MKARDGVWGGFSGESASADRSKRHAGHAVVDIRVCALWMWMTVDAVRPHLFSLTLALSQLVFSYCLEMTTTKKGRRVSCWLLCVSIGVAVLWQGFVLKA